MVLSYSFLWTDEHQVGREEGVKERPCVVVLAVEQKDNDIRVTVCPVTHAPPKEPKFAVEIPRHTKMRLGMDDERSWIVVTELNRFIWPGPDVRPTPLGRWAYGVLSPRLLKKVSSTLLLAYRSRRIALIHRTD